jgi:hypothetical protein
MRLLHLLLSKPVIHIGSLKEQADLLKGRMMRRVLSIVIFGAIFIIGITNREGFANGTETLGLPPADLLEPGTGIVAAGVGLISGQPQSINFTIPAGATVKTALIYANGFSTDVKVDQLWMKVNGQNILMNRIGGNTNVDEPGGPTNSSTYRRNITGFNLVQPGPNTLSFDGLTADPPAANFNLANNGVGVFVVFDDGG